MIKEKKKKKKERKREVSKVTPTVFTTLKNGMDASPTKRLSTGTLSLLEGGPQRSTPVFCSLSFNLFFIIHLLISWPKKWPKEWTQSLVIALSKKDNLKQRQAGV